LIPPDAAEGPTLLIVGEELRFKTAPNVSTSSMLPTEPVVSKLIPERPGEPPSKFQTAMGAAMANVGRRRKKSADVFIGYLGLMLCRIYSLVGEYGVEPFRSYFTISI
jgi:hypothetical protein